MKKFITLLLVLTGMVSTAMAATETTVYYAVPSSTVGSYTVKLNVNITGAGYTDNWKQYDMNLTTKMYQGYLIYSYTYTDTYDGVKVMQFQLYDGSTYKSQQQPIGEWTSVSVYNGKMYVHNTGWVDYSTGPSVAVHFLKPDGWSAVNAYAWDRKGRLNAEWSAAPAISPNTLNTSYYDFVYDEIYDHVIFSNNHGSGENQTNNIEIDFTAATPEYWVTCDGTKDDGKLKATVSTTPPASFNYTRNVTSGNFGTICLPYAATVEGATVFKIVSTVGSGDGLTGINLESVTELEAGKAYIFKATSTSLTATLSGNYTEASAGYGMMGNIGSTTTVPQGNYVVGGDNKIHKVTGDAVNVGQYKGYITLEGISPVPARGLDFISFDGGDVTAIETVQTAQKANNEYFNLAGQRVAQPTKGLYIVNGKKVIIK